MAIYIFNVVKYRGKKNIQFSKSKKQILFQGKIKFQNKQKVSFLGI